MRFVEDESGTDVRSETQAAAADSRLRVYDDPSSRYDPPGRASADVKEHSFVRSAVIGEEIVNCATFWFPPPKPAAEIYNAPVVVLANNDCTVTIVDLPTSDELQTIKFEDCINRALISPDGQKLVAIGDDPYMYIYNRFPTACRREYYIPPTEDSLGILKLKPKYEWIIAAKILLVGQRSSDKADTRGSFAASFSKSGKYLAVGTQYGYISVYDATLLENPDADPLIKTFTTSRPNSKRGAVRDLEFSPEPYDLLTWTENTGRVGIADARDKFMTRQIICIDSRAQGMKRMSLFDGDEALLPASPEVRNRAAAESRNQTETEGGRSDSPDLLSESVEHRRLREELANDMLQRITPETSSAFEVLQALQEQRSAREALREAQAAARDGRTSNTSATMSGARVTYNAIERMRDYREGLTDRTTTTTQSSTFTTPSASTLPSIRDFTNADRRDASLRAYIVERNQERERRGQPPRRRGSVLMDAAGRALERERDYNEFRADIAARSANITQTDREANPQDGLTRLPPRLPPIGSGSGSPPISPWAELETLYSIAVDPPVDTATRLRIETESEPHLYTAEHVRRLAERGLADLRANQLPPAYSRSQNGILRLAPSIDPDETTGCSWSPNGRILFVGTEDGIFEYHVNTIARKFFPSMALR